MVKKWLFLGVKYAARYQQCSRSRAGENRSKRERCSTLREHIKEVVEGEAFKGSHRSVQFLKYIVDQAIAGHFECLKERVIGVELFRRPPSYDTGEDAIVRVTASDVRRRLLQHYGRYGNTSKFRIQLPLGSYIPEITRESNSAPKVGVSETVAPHDGDGKNHNYVVTEAYDPLAARKSEILLFRQR